MSLNFHSVQLVCNMPVLPNTRLFRFYSYPYPREAASLAAALTYHYPILIT